MKLPAGPRVTQINLPDDQLVQLDCKPAGVGIRNVGGRRTPPLCRTLLRDHLPGRSPHLRRQELPAEETKDQHNQRT